MIASHIISGNESSTITLGKLRLSHGIKVVYFKCVIESEVINKFLQK